MTIDRRPACEIDGKSRTVRALYGRLAEQISIPERSTQEVAP